MNKPNSVKKSFSTDVGDENKQKMDPTSLN